MPKNRARRRADRRARVERAERVKPTPETLAKLKPWTMAELLRRGPEDDGIDPNQHEAAIEIVDAFKALTREMGYRPLTFDRIGRGAVDLGPRDLRLVSIYLAWAGAYMARWMVRPHVVVEWIEDERPIYPGDLLLLRAGLDLWDRIRSDIDRAQSALRRQTGSV